MMAVDLHQSGDTTSSLLPFEFLPQQDDDDHHHHHVHVLPLSRSQQDTNINHNTNSHKEDDLIAELTRHMDHRFLLQDHHAKFDLSPIRYQNSELLSWDLIGSPQSSLWSPLGSNQGSSEGSSQEPSPPPTPKSCNWNNTLDERFNSSTIRYHHTNHETQSFNNSSIINNIGSCPHQSLIQEQIRAIELSRLKQDQVRLLKQKLDANWESGEGNISPQKSKSMEDTNESHKNGKGGGPPRNICPSQTPTPMRPQFIGGSGSRAGTGVFLPRSPPPQSTKKQGDTGKGCSTVLIPARVVQALQQHFDQISTTSGPKAAVAFPPLHDVLVSNRDGMYSLLQKRQSRKSEANEIMTTLPQEWTY